MTATIRIRTVPVYILLLLLALLGLGGLYGGVLMLIDPSGGRMGLDVSLLASVPVDNFLLPGLILATVFGLLPLFVVYGLWALPDWAQLQRINRWRDYHWSWSWARVIAVLLVLWIGLEFLMWGNASPLQPALLALGLAVLIMCEYGSVKRYVWVGEPPAVERARDVTTERAEDTEGE